MMRIGFFILLISALVAEARSETEKKPRGLVAGDAVLRPQGRVTTGGGAPRKRQARVPANKPAGAPTLSFDFLKNESSVNGIPFPEITGEPVPAEAFDTAIPSGPVGGASPVRDAASVSVPVGGTGGGSGSGASPNVNTIGFNDSAPDGRAPVKDLKGSPNGRGGPGGQGGGGAQALPKWFPVCMLIDPDIPNGNDIVKGVVEHAARCGVVMEVFPFTVRQTYPNDPGAINQMAKTACNLTEVMGVENAAVSTLVRFTDTAGRMCGETENPESVAGCSEMGGGPKGGQQLNAQEQREQQDRLQSSGHFGGRASGGVAANIVARQGADADTTMHEFGHGILAEENGGRIGLGLGRGGGGGGGGEGFNAEGCAVFQASAFDNDGTHVFDPQRQTYYVKTDNPRFQRDMTENRSFFEGGPPGLPPIPPKPPARPPVTPPPSGEDEATPPPAIASNGGGAGPLRVASVSFAGPPESATPVVTTGPASKHKKPSAVSSSGETSSLTSSGEFFAEPAGKGESTKTVGFNDEAEDDGEALTENFFDKKKSDVSGATENRDGAKRLLASVTGQEQRSGPELAAVGPPPVASGVGKSDAEIAGGAADTTGQSPTAEDGARRGFNFDFSGDDFLQLIAEKTKEILDSEFFTGIFSGEIRREERKNERGIRIVDDIY